jgi:Aldo/keto reductase family
VKEKYINKAVWDPFTSPFLLLTRNVSSTFIPFKPLCFPFNILSIYAFYRDHFHDVLLIPPNPPTWQRWPSGYRTGNWPDGLSAFYGATAPDEERMKFLDHVYKSGQRFWDSADIYGDNEDLLGKYVAN